MFTLFPERSDDLLDTAALPPTENTELNYRTRHLTSGQEWRLIGLLLFGSLPAMLTLSFVIHFLCSAIPRLGDVLISLSMTYGGWLCIRRLTGALQRCELLVGYGLLAGSMGGIAWELARQLQMWSFEMALATAWFTSCMIARQAAAWIVVRARRHWRWLLKPPS
jgi:hypothetical protein